MNPSTFLLSANQSAGFVIQPRSWHHHHSASRRPPAPIPVAATEILYQPPSPPISPPCFPHISTTTRCSRQRVLSDYAVKLPLLCACPALDFAITNRRVAAPVRTLIPAIATRAISTSKPASAGVVTPVARDASSIDRSKRLEVPLPSQEKKTGVMQYALLVCPFSSNPLAVELGPSRDELGHF